MSPRLILLGTFSGVETFFLASPDNLIDPFSFEITFFKLFPTLLKPTPFLIPDKAKPEGINPSNVPAVTPVPPSSKSFPISSNIPLPIPFILSKFRSFIDEYIPFTVSPNLPSTCNFDKFSTIDKNSKGAFANLNPISGIAIAPIPILPKIPLSIPLVVSEGSCVQSAIPNLFSLKKSAAVFIDPAALPNTVPPSANPGIFPLLFI